MDIDLRHLRYFIAVAEEGHITRAAERLGMQQPPLSQQIKALETRLGVQLFRRRPRGVEPTAAGRALLLEARAVLTQLDRALDVTRRTARGEEGKLSVGITPTAPFHPFVPQLIRRFRAAFPRVTLTVEEGLTQDLLRLEGQRIDVAFVRNRTVASQGLSVTSLFDEDLLVALPDGHALAQDTEAANLSMKRLAQEPFVLYGPAGSGIHDATIAACLRAGFSPHIVQLAPRITSTLGLVAAGIGVTLVPESTRCIGIDGVVYRALHGGVPPKAVLDLVSRRGDPSAVVRHFVRTAKAHLADYTAR